MIVTRFAPSPTGFLHVGNLRAALLSFAFARQNDGRFLLRLDDTDLDRSTETFADAIQEDLTWLGLSWDGLFRQSTRHDVHVAAAQRLETNGHLVPCFETAEDLKAAREAAKQDGRAPVFKCANRNPSLTTGSPHKRFVLDNRVTTWTDLIHGDMAVATDCLSDPILARSDGSLLYTLASVSDDVDLGVTHVIRGDDHLTNTAVHIQIARALGHVPTYGHHSLFTGPNGQGLSKRLGSLSLRDLRKDGVSPRAVRSLVLKLGTESAFELTRNLEDLVSSFNIRAYNSAPVAFDPEHLKSLTRADLRETPLAEVDAHLHNLGVPVDTREAFWNAVKGAIATRDDIEVWWALCQNGPIPLVAEEDKAFVRTALEILTDSPDDISWADWTKAVSQTTGRTGKNLYKPLRHALTGRKDGPEMALLFPLLSKKPTTI